MVTDQKVSLARSGWRVRLPALLATAAISAAACGSSARSTSSPTAGGVGSTDRAGQGTAPTSSEVIQVAADENFWGSIASQVGGVHVHVTSIITDPNADPHVYEPTPADGRTMATAELVIVNGIGYDPWAPKLLAADPGSRTVLTAGDLLGVKDGGNPHRWYNPGDVQTVIRAYVADLSRLDPADAGYFHSQQTQFDTVALKPYDDLIAQIKAKYSGAPVGASESIFSMLAPALGLNVLTPYSFLRAISEGTDVTAADKSTIDHQITTHQIKIYVYNSQNTTPDVQAQLSECKAAGIPTTTITEILTPATATYQDWQTTQLQGILDALNKAAAG
jgi:zinc/manganese transport system substrate-binding protein